MIAGTFFAGISVLSFGGFDAAIRKEELRSFERRGLHTEAGAEADVRIGICRAEEAGGSEKEQKNK